MSRSRPARFPLAIVLAFGGLLFTPRIATSSTPIENTQPYVPNEVLIKFRPSATPAQIRSVMTDLGATRVRRFRSIQAEEHRITRYSVPDAVNRYKSHPSVEVIEPNWIVQADVVPNDPVFNQEWGLLNTGQTGGTPGADIDATLAWDLQTGSSDVVVAIIDTGMDYTHPDLAANVWTNPDEIPGNGIDDDGNGWVDDVHGFDFINFDFDPMDDNGHGTHVSGTISAIGGNGLGVSGVAWGVRLMPLKFLGASGSGPISAAVMCVEYATQMGADIMNNSWGGGGFSTLLQLAIQNANTAGIAFVAAAGNSSVNIDPFPHYPASYAVPNVIAVASTTHFDQLSSFSNYGPATVPVAAPGSSIWSTLPGGNYGPLSGTSMAAPHVSGALALLKSQFPAMSLPQMKAVLINSSDPVPALSGYVGSGGRINAFRMLAGLDSIPPDPIQDLAVESTESNRIRLSWTATGDDGATGRASRYDLRYSTGPINESNFASALEVSGLPVPATAGSVEHVTASELDFETDYTFAVRAIDEYGNASPISNLAAGRTLGAPDIAVAPSSLAHTLLTGQTGEETLTISNTSLDGTLDFAALAATPPATGLAQPSMTLAKGAPDPRVGDPVIQGQGGPDSFGHTWIDSDSPGGPAFQWVDIASPANLIPLTGDDLMSPLIAVGFTFPYYDNLFQFARVSTNGFLSFSSNSADYTNQPLPSPFAPENMLAPFWDDLYFDSGSAAYAMSDGLRFIVEWTNVVHYGGGGPYTFEMILQRDGTVLYQYQSMASPTNSSTVGIQNATRDDGLTVAFNASYVHSGLAVMIRATPRWLSLAPELGTIGPGQSAPVAIRFDASGLPGGEYDAAVRVTSNDPDESAIQIPVHLSVTAAPDISLPSTPLEFVQVFVGSSESTPLSVVNDGVQPLTVTQIRVSPSVFEVDGGSFTLSPGEAREVEVRFRPVVPGAVSGLLEVSSDDPDEGVATVALHGTAILPPDITLSPSSLSASLFTGETTTRGFSIGNVGASDLSWRAFLRGGMNQSYHPFSLEVPTAQGEPPDGRLTTNDPSERRTGAIQAELADLTGVRIVFDRAHGNSPPDIWSGIIASLTARGALFATNSSAITPTVLAGIDVLWLTDSSVPWSSAEIAALHDWLAAGGALLMEGDNPSTVDTFNPILSALGAGFSYLHVSGTSGITNHIYPHATTRNVSTINFDGNIASLSADMTIPAGRLLDDVAGVPGGAYSLLGSGKLLAVADELFSDFHAGFADNQLFANQVFDWLGGISWLRVSPGSGVTVAGSTSPVVATFDAAGLPSGDYAADIVAASNDPDEPEPTIAVTLHVTGSSDIDVSPTSLDYGPLFIGLSRVDSLRVVNTGVDPLLVSSVELGDDQLHANVSSFDLTPGQIRNIAITFVPTRAGAVSTTAVLRSNDPDEGVVTIPITAVGQVPPDIDVQPDSFSEALDTGETVARTVHIANLSGSDLDWSVDFEEPGQDSTASTPGPSSGPGPLPASTRRWSEYISDSAQVLPGPGAAYLIEPLSLPVVVRDSLGDGGSVDLTFLRGSPRNGQLQVEMELGTIVNPLNFGGFLSLDIDQNRYTGYLPSFGNPYQDIGAEFEFQFFNLALGHVDLVDLIHGIYVGAFPAQITAHSIRFAVPLSTLGNDDGHMNVTGVIGDAIGPTDWFPDRGHGEVGGVDWLSAEPADGRLRAGEGIDVVLTFDARSLDGGEYDANVIVENNDPDESRLALPAHLSVHGTPLLAVLPESLQFGARYLGTRLTKALTVFNIGSAPLSVSALSFDDPSYTADIGAFTLAPHTSRPVGVTFAPAVSGSHHATLSLTHNAASSPTPVVLDGQGIPPPVVSATPSPLQASVESGAEVTRPLTVGNSGGSDLIYSLAAVTAAGQVEVQEPMDIPRGTEDPRHGDPVATGAGGPDAFGYRWIDSDQSGGPIFNWVEISQIGTRIPMSALDANFGPIGIGFEFPFYGSRFTSFRICTHGWISFTNFGIQYANQPLPSHGAPENLLAAFWEDLNFSGVERAYYYNDGTRLIIQYTSVPATGGGGPYTFEIILYPTGVIVYQYLTMGSPTNGATIGIQNGARNDGLQIAFNTAYIHDNLAIRIAPAPAWLALDPSAGTVPPGGSDPIAARFSANNLFPGDYPARLFVSSNDPVTPNLEVPVTMHVIGIPDLLASPTSMAFDTLYVGQEATRTLRITNIGTDRLDVVSITPGNAAFSVTPGTVTLPPLQSAEITIRFAPTAAGNYATNLVLASNDPDSPAELPITAIALVPPRIVIDPGQIVAVALPGGQGEKTVRVQNTGGSDLRWSASQPITVNTAAQTLPGDLVVAKGDTDPRAGVLGTGGPDAWGHNWIDSDHAGGPTYDWLDIRQFGTRVPFNVNADDENHGPYPIGFTFPFYDGAFTSFRVCSNGWISFTSASNSWNNQPLPSAAPDAPENLIAPVWDDLLMGGGASVHYYSDGQRLIVQWSNLVPLGIYSPTGYNFQAILYASGEIEFQYESLGSAYYFTTTGIQNGTKTDGLTVAFNTFYLHPGMAVRFYQSPRWLRVSPPSGVIAAGQAADVHLVFDASQLAPGDYQASVPFLSNDPAAPVAAEGAMFHVGSVDAAVADLDPNTLNLGSEGQWIVARAELPAGYDPAMVVPSTVRFLGTLGLPDDPHAFELGDFNANGIPDLTMRFDRAAAEALLPEGDGVEVAVTGEIRDMIYFTARDLIRVIRPQVAAPNGGERVLGGSPYMVRWEDPPGSHVDHADLVYSLDGGVTWQLIASGVVGNSYAWTVPQVVTAEALVRVFVYDTRGVMGYDTSDGPFAIQSTISSVESQEETLPRVFALRQNAPNPFNPRTEIRFDMPRAGRVAMRVFGVDGRLVREWKWESMPAGRHRVVWDGRDGEGRAVASGVYFSRLSVSGASTFEATRRMMLVK